MIYCLTGKIIKKTLNAVVLSCGGVGYFAQCPASVAGALPGVGKDATIYTVMSVSAMLQKELPGLRGFSTTSIRNMRIFYEEWNNVLNHQPLADDLVLNEEFIIG